MKTILYRAAGLLMVLALAACATKPQQPVSLSDAPLHASGGRIGVAVTPMPKVDFTYPGANCLLCMAAASVGNSALIEYTRTLGTEDLATLQADLVQALRARGWTAVAIEEPVDLKALPDRKEENKPAKDFTGFAKRYDIDTLYVAQINAVGISRTYAAYIPTSDPKGVVSGLGYIVDLKDNSYRWYSAVDVQKSADGAWDEPPKYPGLTNAYFQALELAKDAFRPPVLR